MAITTRQSGLLVAEDWTKVYQTFRNADFQSYDYETLRKSMIDYIKLYYPEDFNDFIESSEFIALIDLLSFLGQSLAFRGDLNARENFIDTAQRRDSILKLARLISYNPKRNTPASGFLKIDSVSTTENVYDSNGLNLSGLVIEWNDSGNDNWLEQFTAVLNASLNANQVVGKPSNSQVINGITNDEYEINLVSGLIPTYSFESTVEEASMKFEAVSPTSVNENYVYEQTPAPEGVFNLLYRNDNLGNNSNNTGFFVYFKQGELKSVDFSFRESIPNRVYPINVDNINNTDIWLYSLDSNNNPDTLWTAVPTVNNNNVIYQNGQETNIYQVNTRAGDQIDLVFGDGSFSNIPQGNFRLYYRVSNGLDYKITPDEMQSVSVPISYISRSGRPETITVVASLRYTVANATARETVEEVREKAPQQYYTQDRMVTGEDYNILPYTLFNSVLKAKAVNRTSSGVSRYLDVIDTTGKYSSTNIFAQDGYLYRDPFVRSFSFEFTTTNDIYRTIYNRVRPIASSEETKQFFYANYQLINLSNVYWNQASEIANGSTGYFYDDTQKILQVGDIVSSNNSYIRESAIVKFAPGGVGPKYFDAQNEIQDGVPSQPGDKFYIYAAVDQVIGDGTNGGLGNLSSGKGPITLNANVPDGAEAVQVFAQFNTDFTTALINEMIGYVQGYKDFALRYDVDEYTWKIVLPQDLNPTEKFSLSNEGDTTGQGLDASWLIHFETQGETYTVNYRGLDYIFESKQETNFYFDENVKIFDPVTGFTITDQIKVLKINSEPDSNDALGLDYIWYVYKKIVGTDGYEESSKIKITFPDSNNDGVPDNPELFELIVDPDVNGVNKYVYFQETSDYDSFETLTPLDSADVVSTFASLTEIQTNQTRYQDGQLFYIPSLDTFYQLAITGVSSNIYTVSAVTGYVAKQGRQNLYFQYRHNSPNYRRIDPSPNNIIDLYVLTKQYATDYTNWIQDTSGTVTEPEVPTSQDLATEFGSLENYKSISDTIIYNSAEFKPIIGNKADLNLQATIKVVKNQSVVISDNEVKARVIDAVNQYFDVANWDFGETFYFSELSAYLHSVLAPDVSSIIIVPASESSVFGSLMQINAEYNQIIVSAATVDDVQIISAITAAQINQTTGLVS